MTSKSDVLLVGVAGLVLLAGCAHYPVNAQLTMPAERGYRFDEVADDDSTSLFVCLALSGGGTRAAALSYGVLAKLRDTRIRWRGKERSLLDEVDCISSVSGGSFTAAYYGLFGKRIFKDFRARFLERNIQGRCWGGCSIPTTGCGCGLPYAPTSSTWPST